MKLVKQPCFFLCELFCFPVENSDKIILFQSLNFTVLLTFAMLLIIDNYDSFTYNLVQYLGELGAEMRIFRNDEITVREAQEINPSSLLISPGPGTPRDAGISIPLIKHFAKKLPILGVCLGHQAIGEFFGGKISRAPEPIHGKPSTIYHDGRGVFLNLKENFLAGRYHSLIVERESLPECLKISAETSDGLIMGLRHKDLKIEGVQFHPESIMTSDGKKILQNFLDF